MEQSEKIDELTKAYVQFQTMVKPIAKTSENPYFHSKYADLSEIIGGTKAELCKCGLSVIQGSEPAVDGVSVTTLLMHVSGQWIKSTLYVRASKLDPQGYGSAFTYARRYSLSGILNLATEDDDDGNSATQKEIKKSKPTPKQWAECWLKFKNGEVSIEKIQEFFILTEDQVSELKSGIKL
jgi:hypothetical protein